MKENEKAELIAGRRKVLGHGAKGFSFIELVLVVAIAGILMATAFPIMNRVMTSMHLGSAATSLAGAIQNTRYLAISLGCPYTLTVLPSQNAYQLATEPISGTPPACGTTFVNTGNPVPFASSDISTTFNTPLLLNPSGTITAVGSIVPSSFSITLASENSAATKTIVVTGVGDVKVHTP